MQTETLILVVEDDPVLKKLLGHTFASKYQMLYAGNGAEALQLLNEHTPSLILLDLMMPDMDGFTFLQKMQERTDAVKDVPVIVVSNLGQQQDIERAKSLGAKDYLVKAEVSVEEIIGKIQEVLASLGVSAQAASATAATASAPQETASSVDANVPNQGA